MILEMRVLRPAEGVYAFYDGRVEGRRFAEGPNWVRRGRPLAEAVHRENIETVLAASAG